MIETVNLTKIYKPKKGVPVTALNNVSIRFPQSGMVFLLGKSGSGKSTLLNGLGGLDSYDGGDILIKAVSTKSFKQQHFDSYRNTYVGFIFQEYNILDEFSVGANVALAIELQGRKATDNEINSILRQVDLDGYGYRKPNELSGGQKQRVAIARALVKNPQIIMADEPTGALDSVTGRQVLDTLKALSKDKLVIVVSHDREFAENYADRVIELADGVVISDVTYENSTASSDEADAPDAVVYGENGITVSAGYRLTEEDREQINAYLASLQEGTAAHISVKNVKKSERKSAPTDQEQIPRASSRGFNLIKSRLPMKFAFKMGASGLKYKKIRLFFTVLLSCVAFGLFGLSDTFGSYDYVENSVLSIKESDINYAALTKSVKTKSTGWGAGEDDYYFESGGHYFNENDLLDIYERTGVRLNGVYLPNHSDDIDFFDNVGSENYDETQYLLGSPYSTRFGGFATVNDRLLTDAGLKLTAGRLPDGSKNEIAISNYICSTFTAYGYVGDDGKASKIEKPEDMLGKTVAGYTVVGVIDTNVDLERYRSAFSYDDSISDAELILRFALQNEFSYLTRYSYAAVAMVGDGFIERMVKEEPRLYPAQESSAVIGIRQEYSDGSIEGVAAFWMFGELDGTVKREDIVWLTSPHSLADDELIVSKCVLTEICYQSGRMEEVANSDDVAAMLEAVKDVKTYLMTSWWSDEIPEQSYRIVGAYDSDSLGIGAEVLGSKSVISRYAREFDGDYSYAVGAMPESSAAIRKLVRLNEYDDSTQVIYELQNAAVYELRILNNTIDILAGVFFWVGFGFAVFAVLLLSNFIATSISHKKQEIGILRAIGSRGNDVFRIFFSESFIIAMAEFLLTTAGLFLVVAWINGIIRQNTGLLITVLNCGMRQVAIELIVSLAVAAAASFIPVKRIASKKPIDAIRQR